MALMLVRLRLQLTYCCILEHPYFLRFKEQIKWLLVHQINDSCTRIRFFWKTENSQCTYCSYYYGCPYKEKWQLFSVNWSVQKLSREICFRLLFSRSCRQAFVLIIRFGMFQWFLEVHYLVMYGPYNLVLWYPFCAKMTCWYNDHTFEEYRGW